MLFQQRFIFQSSMDNDLSSYERHAARRQMITKNDYGGPSHVNEPSWPDRGRDSRRPLITRVNRACNGCRRAKIRCIGAENPPCERCRLSEQPCILEKPPKVGVDQSAVDDRLQTLESQMLSMQQLLQDVVHAVCPEIASDRRQTYTSPNSGSGILSGSPNTEYSQRHTPRFWHPAPDNQSSRPLHMSLPPSRAGSEGPGDILAMEEISNPLGVMSTVAGRVEKALERSRGTEGQEPRDDVDSNNARRKRLRVTFSPSTDVSGLPQGGNGQDPISLGLISVEEGLALVDIFYAGSSDFINCYDPNTDTFESLRERSTFSLTAVMMVGARVRDGGGPMSSAHRISLEYTQRMAMKTLIQPASSVEDVRAMILLAAFGENGWLIAGHAVRMAIDLGINHSFDELLRGGMGAVKGVVELERERHLVIESRVWYCVYRLEHQMSYGMGRPAIVREDSTIQNCRRLLDHPLALDSDARLIYAVELLAIRAPLHIELTATPNLPLDHETLSRLRWANEQFDTWERYWDDALSRRYGIENTGFVRESLTMQRQLAELFINSQLLRGVRNAADAAAMSSEKRDLALRAMRNALHCVNICLRGHNYKAGLPYGTHYTHVCAAFAASFLVRVGRVFPNELDLRRVAEDVEEMAAVLSRVPAGRYARSLRLILRKARSENVIPTTTNLVSTTSATTLAPATTDWLDALNMDQNTFAPAENALGRMGFDRDAPLPLFLNGDSLGTSIGPSDSVPFLGLEDFFVPVELDDLLASLGSGTG